MAQFRTTADLLDLILHRAGEVTNGNSPYETDALNYLNSVHFSLIAGGTIVLSKDVSIEIDEVWPWSRARAPMLLELQPRVADGSITLTLGSESGTFSSAPTSSLAGWHIRVTGRDEVFKIASHTASSTAFELDAAYPDESGSGLTYEAFKLDYDLIPSYIVIDSTNNKIDFKKTSGGSELTATLTAGTYSPSDLATHVGTQMTAATTGPTFTCSYSSTTRKFTLTTNAAGSTVLLPLFATGSNQAVSAHGTLGFDDVDSASATSHVGVYALGCIARLVTPMTIANLLPENKIAGVDNERFLRDFALRDVCQGYPDRFTVLWEKPDGTFTVRFNKFPVDKTRVEVPNVPVPRDLKNSAGSIPLVPRKHADVLVDAVASFLLVDKNDDKAAVYINRTQAKLQAMVSQNRGELERMGENFGAVIARPDLETPPTKLRYGYTS